VLQECIARAGSLEGGLRYYVGAANLNDDGGYASKVLAEHERLLQVANGRNPSMVVTPSAPIVRAQPIPIAIPPKPEQANEPAADPQKVALLSEVS
jgi:hypothetical protein